MIRLQLDPTKWPTMVARIDQKVIDRWFRAVRGRSQEAFARGMLGPHTGRLYKRTGGSHRASVDNDEKEYAANDSGKLLASLRSKQSKTEVKIGSGDRSTQVGKWNYADLLRTGTKKMARRRMSDNALQEGADAARPQSRGWMAWQGAKKK